MNLEDFNRRWLAAWSAKDVPALLGFYAEDVAYFDPQVPHGLKGQDALRGYLEGLFAATPPMRYDPEEIWITPTGFCGRWYCVVGDDPKAAPAMRGFDLCVIKDGRIVLNEVYVHPLMAAA
jgi:ketosteroid isomerase-like protein